MALAALTRVVQDSAGNAIAGGTVEVRTEISGAPLVALFSDRAGLSSIGNPYTAPEAQFTVFLAPGVYRIDITVDGETATERYAVLLEDVPGEETIEPTEITSGPYDMVEDDDIITVNNTSGAPITINLVTAIGRTKSVLVVDKSGTAATYPITVEGAGSEAVLGGSSYVMSRTRQSTRFYPDQDGSWYA